MPTHGGQPGQVVSCSSSPLCEQALAVKNGVKLAPIENGVKLAFFLFTQRIRARSSAIAMLSSSGAGNHVFAIF